MNEWEGNIVRGGAMPPYTLPQLQPMKHQLYKIYLSIYLSLFVP